MTAKKVRCNLWKTCDGKACHNYHNKPHIRTEVCDCFCYTGQDCIPVKSRKPSPAKPEKIWVTEGHYRSGKKWCWIGRGFKESVPSAKTMLSFCRSEWPKIKYRLREYTAGKVLKD